MKSGAFLTCKNPLSGIAVFFFSFFLVISALVSVDADARDKNVQTEFVADVSAAVPGENFTVAIKQTIRDEWHTYWINPGDSGEPLMVEWDVPAGVEIGALQFPVPKKIVYDPILDYGYGGVSTYLADVAVPQGYTQDHLTITGKASWLVCHEICIPEYEEISLTLPVADTAAAVHQDIFAAAKSNIAVKVDWPATVTQSGDDVSISVDIPQEHHNQFTQVTVYPYDYAVVDGHSEAISDIRDDGVIITQRNGGRDLSELTKTSLILETANGAFEVNASVDAPRPAQAEGADLNLFLAVIFAFIGGIILNLMPCVFPILSMKAMSLVKLSGQERRHAQISGLSYAAGIVVSFVIVAGVLLLLRGGGEAIGWGFQLQNPYIIAFLAWLLFVIGLNLIGLFDIGGRFVSLGAKMTSGHDVRASFFTGILATLVASPCSAPFMASAIGFAVTQNALVALTVFVVLGFGLAFPYLLLCFVPQTQKILPRPGAWMEKFKQALAFLMFLSAIWLVWVLGGQSGTLGMAYILCLFLLTVYAIWFFRAFTGRAVRLIGIGLPFLALLFNICILSPAARDTVFEHYSEQGLMQYLNEDKSRPVFVNMTAAWCITCLVNERTSLSSDEVKQTFEKENVVYIKGDWTNRDDSITAYLERFGRGGVPLYVYYAPADDTGTRPAPVVLPQILTPQIVVETVTGEKK